LARGEGGDLARVALNMTENTWGQAFVSIHLLLCAYRPTVSNENTETLTL